MYSTDPKEMVNNIPLGPNAAIVTVTKVVNKEAFLWRPSADMSFIGDALHENIAWPIHKVHFIQPQARQESLSKNTSPKVNFQTFNFSYNGVGLLHFLDILTYEMNLLDY